MAFPIELNHNESRTFHDLLALQKNNEEFFTPVHLMPGRGHGGILWQISDELERLQSLGLVDGKVLEKPTSDLGFMVKGYRVNQTGVGWFIANFDFKL